MFNSVFHWSYCAPVIFPWYSHPYIYFISLFGSGSSLHPPNMSSLGLFHLSSLILENTCSLAHTEYWSCASCVCITWWNAVLQSPILYIQKYYQFIIIYQCNYLSNQKKKSVQLLTPYYGTFKEFFSLRQKVNHLLIKLRNRKNNSGHKYLSMCKFALSKTCFGVQYRQIKSGQQNHLGQKSDVN